MPACNIGAPGLPGPKLGLESGPPELTSFWWSRVDVFRSVAIAFVKEMEHLAPELERGTFPPEALRSLSHRIRGAAGVFMADATAAAAAVLEEGSHGVTPSCQVVRTLAAAMRQDASRMRAVLRMTDA